MFRIIIFIFITLSFKATSSELLKISYLYHNFSIDLGENKITYKGPQTELSLVKKKCNAHIFNELSRKLSQLNKLSSLKPTTSKAVSIQSGNKSYYLTSENQLFLFLSDFDHQFKSLKIEEKLNCH